MQYLSEIQKLRIKDLSEGIDQNEITNAIHFHINTSWNNKTAMRHQDLQTLTNAVIEKILSNIEQNKFVDKQVSTQDITKLIEEHFTIIKSRIDKKLTALDKTYPTESFSSFPAFTERMSTSSNMMNKKADEGMVKAFLVGAGCVVIGLVIHGTPLAPIGPVLIAVGAIIMGVIALIYMIRFAAFLAQGAMNTLENTAKSIAWGITCCHIGMINCVRHLHKSSALSNEINTIVKKINSLKHGEVLKLVEPPMSTDRRQITSNGLL